MYRKIRKHPKHKDLDMDNLKERLKELLLKLKGGDNFLTTETITIGLVAAVFIIAIVIMVLFPNSRFNPRNLMSNNNVAKISPTPTPTPIPLPKGSREFGVSNQGNPQLRGFKFSEYDPAIGQTQTITLTASDGQEGKIIAIDLKLISDHKTKTYPMKLSTGTATSGDWTASIKTDDTHDYVYAIIFTATNNKGQTVTVKPIFR